MANKVLITGIGLATPIGIGTKEVFDALCQGRTSMQVVSFDTKNGQRQYITGKVPLTLDNFFEHYEKFEHGEGKAKKHDIKNKSCRAAQLALIAGLYAVRDAGFDIRREKNVEVMVGSGIGGAEVLEENIVAIDKGETPSYFFIPTAILGNIGNWIAREFECDGECLPIATACASGTSAIGTGFEHIQIGRCDVVICAGADAVSTRAGLIGFGTTCKIGTLSKRVQEPDKASRPFDKDRDGFVLSEGAGVLVLESERHFKERNGKNAYAEIIGYGASTDKGKSLVEPTLETMRLALEKAFPLGLGPKDIGYVNAHGTSTPINDPLEIRLYREFFGEHAKGIYVNSTKSMLGHSIGAAGAVETAVTAMSIRYGRVHPTINLENLDPECQGMRHVVGKAVEADIRVAVKSSFAFGGHNAVLVMKRYEY
jgi:3-oxoacyl-[acyl-carrier-protein] synthase II